MSNQLTTRNIAFIDSGIGGIPYMIHALQYIQGIRAYYFADTEYFPYGTKDPELLVRRLTALVQHIIDIADPKAIVLACNTASVVALEELRAHFSIPFVGTVPAIKPAVQRSAHSRISIMATEQTLRDPYLHTLIDAYAKNSLVHRVAATGLIDQIETAFFQRDYDGELSRCIASVQTAQSDCLVLGCTHFLHLVEELQKRLGPEVTIIDSREGISRQITRILLDKPLSAHPELTEIGLLPTELESRSSVYISSETKADYYREICQHFGISYVGVANVN